MITNEPESPSEAQGGLYRFPLRLLVLLMASGLSVLLLVYPKIMASASGEVSHGVLTLLLWGIAAGFVHGVGYVPRHTLWRYALGPVVGLGIMTTGVIWLLGKF